MAKVLIAIVIVYLLIIALLYFVQDKMLFFPQTLPDSFRLEEDSTVENVKIKLDNSNILQGWYIRKPTSGKQKVIIYFGGNAEEVSFLVPLAPQIDNWSLLLINYPGYGQSSGKPGEKEFFNAALKIYDHLAALPDTDHENIVVMGRSIGTGVATYLASQRPVKGVILISPYGSIRNVAKEKIGFIPVDLILKHRFEAKIYAQKATAPLLCIYSTDDNIIPPKHSKELFENWAGKKDYYELTGFGHNGVFSSTKLWCYMNAFLKKN